MSLIKDLVGQRFGRLEVISFSHVKHGAYWLCRCDCGGEKIISRDSLKSGYTKSCGCLNRERLKSQLVDITGQRFYRLIAIKYSHTIDNRSYWFCECDCGNKKTVSSHNLRCGETQSCGCLNRELSSKRMSGENHFNWRGGVFGEYSQEWTDELKESIRNRDRRKCQYLDCEYDDTKESKKLSIHHIDGNKQNCQEYNLISLCQKHHMKIEANNPELWINYFYQITRDYNEN